MTVFCQSRVPLAFPLGSAATIAVLVAIKSERHSWAMSTRSDPGRTPRGEAFADLIVAIFRVNGRLLKAGDGLGQDFGLTAARWQVLGSVADKPRTVAQIARHFELTRQGVLWVVRVLCKEGLVEQVHNPSHKRAKLVRLTPAGTAILHQMQSRQADWANRTARAVPEAALEEARAVLEQLYQHLGESPGVAAGLSGNVHAAAEASEEAHAG